MTVRRPGHRGVAVALALGVPLLGVLVVRWPTTPSVVVALVAWAVVGRALVRHATRHDGEDIARLVAWALAAKAAVTLVSYWVTWIYYGGIDASSYDANGRAIATALWAGEPLVYREMPGTGSIDLATGLLYSVIGPSSVAGSLVFSLAGFLGVYLYFRAFRTAVPDGDVRTYGVALFLLPSLLFWSAALGKDSWMVFSLGICALGAARLLNRRRHGLATLLLGLLLCGWVRPHMAFMVAVALALGFTLGRSKRPTLITPLIKLAVAALLVGSAGVALLQFQELTSQEGSTTEVIDQSLSNLERNSAIGNSEFEASSIRTVADVPGGVFTTLFRPLVHEAPNPLALVSAVESLAILWLFVIRPALGRQLTLGSFANGYALFGLLFLLIFCVGFSNVGNFGWLIRQRAQVLPFLIMFPFVHGAARVAPTTPAVRRSATAR